MFKLSATGEYGLILVRYLREHPGLKTLSEIGVDTGIPEALLRKIANRLQKNGIITSVKGRNGGVLLANQRDLSVWEVLSACGEDLEIALCSGTSSCSKSWGCRISSVVRNLQRGFSSILSLTKI